MNSRDKTREEWLEDRRAAKSQRDTVLRLLESDEVSDHDRVVLTELVGKLDREARGDRREESA